MRIPSLALLFLTAAFGAEQRPVDFARDVQPLFVKKCSACHGVQMQMNGLRLDNADAVVRGGHSGPAIVAGDSAKSLLIRRVTSSQQSLRMPPTGPPLAPGEVELIRGWIDAGAHVPLAAQTAPKPHENGHWAYQTVRKPAVPAVRRSDRVRNPIDAFVFSRLEAEKIEPAGEAERSALLRRLCLDLTGLPPSSQETAAFVADDRPDAYERLVDRLLTSPRHGEKWARMWLDLAHYADSDGYEKDQVRPYAWRYRHWVIDAINRDMPFDRFSIEQIAGDQLPAETVEQRVATGFFRNTLTNREAGVDRAEARFEQVVNRTNTFGTVWLGLTVGCAQCHDHKFDAISQKEYYQLFSFFNSVIEENIDAPLSGELGPYLKARPEYEDKRLALLAEYDVPALEPEWESLLQGALANPGKSHEWDFQLTSMRAMVDNAERVLRTPPAQRTASQKRRLTDYFIASPGPALGRDKAKLDRLKELRTKLREVDAAFPALSQAPVIVEDQVAEPTHIHVRGDWRRKGIPVEPAALAVLPPITSGDKPTRVTLARWLFSREHPLTARVAVNRIWQELFGRGLVFTSNDFGVQGEKPANPELLDWLAAEFMENGWSQKRLIRTIVTSSTYRQSSKVRPELMARDPNNTLLARQSRLRLSAELVRDSALAVSGLLDPTIGGKSVRPPQPKGIAELGYGGSVKWEENQGPERYRRGLYIHFQRTTPYPQLMTFDAPDSNVSCTRRERSNTPLQALNLLNDPVFHEAAQALAWRIEREGPADIDGRLEYAYQLSLARSPSLREKERLRRYIDQEAQISSPTGNPWLGVSRVLLNTDEFITRE